MLLEDPSGAAGVVADLAPLPRDSEGGEAADREGGGAVFAVRLPIAHQGNAVGS